MGKLWGTWIEQRSWFPQIIVGSFLVFKDYFFSFWKVCSGSLILCKKKYSRSLRVFMSVLTYEFLCESWWEVFRSFKGNIIGNRLFYFQTIRGRIIEKKLCSKKKRFPLFLHSMYVFCFFCLCVCLSSLYRLHR